MSRPTNNYLVNEDKSRRNIDFLASLAEIGKPFNSTLLDKYPEYLSDKELGIYERDEKECFLSILNKIGEDGCQVLTDQVVNYIDDISNIDITIPSALLSQAESLGYPYKDKKYVEQLSRLSKCSPLLQSLVWAVSTKASNSITILERLNILSDETKSEISSDISAHYNTDYLNTEISGDIYDLFNPNKPSSIFGRRYLYLDRGINGDYVRSDDSPALIDFTWMANAIFSDSLMSSVIDSERSYLSDYNSYVINFGKYNYTIFTIVCYTYLYSKLFTLNSTNPEKDEQVEKLNLNIDEWNKYSKEFMPFLYDNNLFDPLQAAWSIIYDDRTIDDYEVQFHPIILDFIKAFNERLNNVSYDVVLDWLNGDQEKRKTINENLSFVLKLNANSFTYQQLMARIIADVKNVFSIDIVDYTKFKTIFHNDYFSNYNHLGGFSKLETSLLDEVQELIDWKGYISEIVSKIFELGKNIRTLREDLRVMTLRNSYKGTTALIQFSVIEYLKECIGDLLGQSFAQYNRENPDKEQKHLSKELLESILTTLNGDGSFENQGKKQENVEVNEYWDYTEYFNRVDEQPDDDGHRVDWYLDKGDFAHKYGTMNEDDILEFYTKVLNLSKDIYFTGTEDDEAHEIDWTDPATQKSKLKAFLSKVYNIGVFTTRTNSNYESIYSGNKNTTTNNMFWEVYKNSDYISKEIHPYIWNFVKNVSNRLYSSSAVTTAIQNLEYEILSDHINGDTNSKNITGNILDQYRLSENFVDSSGYVTRYEHRDHEVGEVTQSYDGIVHPMFGWQFIKNNWWENIEGYWGDISSTWYTDQKVTLSKNMAQKEKSCLNELKDNTDFMKSLTGDGVDSQVSGVLGDYCIDKYETAYAVEPHGEHRLIYKENGYPFMRPLLNGDKGMLFLKANYEIDDEEKSDVDYTTISNDSFPRIVMSRDGTHILMRTGKNKLSSYTVLTSKNKNNEFEKALKLNAEIACDDIIFEKDYFNDNLIKTVDDDFYILVPRYDSDISAFNNYLFYIKKTGEIKAVKETFKSESPNEIFKSGMFLNNNSGKNILINTFYVNKDQTLSEDSEVSAVYKDGVNHSGNHTTSYENWNVSTSSFDVLNQFIQMYVSNRYEKSESKSRFKDIPLDNENELSARPSVDLTIDAVDSLISSYQNEIQIVDGFFNAPNLEKNLYTSTGLPFARSFNINSDAGFNPVYIGERGKIILQNHRGDPKDNDIPSQWKLLKETGTAFELLGPEIKFEDNPVDDSSIDNDIYDVNTNDNDIAFERIHECYSFADDYDHLAQSFDISNNDRKSSYRYGYASVVENEENKADVYRIKNVFELTLNKYDDYEEPTLVSTDYFDSFEIKEEDRYNYNRIYIFIGVDNKLYSLIPRKPTTLLQSGSEISSEFNGIAGKGDWLNKAYSIKFEDTYVFNEIQFVDSSVRRHIKLYGNARELINAKVYLVHVVGNTSLIANETALIDRSNGRNFILREETIDGESSLYFIETSISDDPVDHITIEGDNGKYFNVFSKDNSLYIEETTNADDIDSSVEYFKIKDNSTGLYSWGLDVNNSSSTPSVNIFEIEPESSDDSNSTDGLNTPNFMLPQHELTKRYPGSPYSEDLIDEHMRAPHTSTTIKYQNVKNATTDFDDKHEHLDIDKTDDGSLVFSITEVDSDLMNTKIPDQWKEHKPPKSVTTEAINACMRYQVLKNTTFDMLDYSFRPFEIIDLDLKRVSNPDVDTGIDERDNSVDVQYIIQPYEGSITVNKDDTNKYTVSFWRREEKSANGRLTNSYDDNKLPNRVKITDLAKDETEKYPNWINNRPVHGQEHESLNKFIDKAGFVPKLMVQWEYNGSYNDDGSNDNEIYLRFNNAATSDSSFINTNAGLEYKSLSTFKDSIIVKPRESKYIDIVAPNHVQIGRTVFYNIPIMRALVTNVSDNKPKFMLTILNDKVDKRVTLGYTNYALVFMSSSTPQIDNSNVVYTTCYVAPMVSSNQTTPPSVSNAIALSELSFNFDIANVLNVKNIINEETGVGELTNNNLLVERINPITPENKLSETAKTCISVAGDMHQIRVSEPYKKVDSEDEDDRTSFLTVDMKINLQDLTKLNLKNALLTAHGNVIAYDKFGNAVPIVRIFGCSLDRIGAKHVLTVNKNDILTVTQSSDRTTAIQVTEDSTQEDIT